MARALQALIPHPPITGASSFRRLSQLPSLAYSPFSGCKSIAPPLLWELRSVSRMRSIRASAKSLQGNGDGEKQFPQVASTNWTKSLAKIASDNFLPLALICGVLLGLANPGPGCLADKFYVSKISTFGIFVISGLTLRSDEIGAAAEAWPVGLFGLASILLFTPVFSKIILMLKLQPQEFVTGLETVLCFAFALYESSCCITIHQNQKMSCFLFDVPRLLVYTGLAIFSCMPTTLSSGVALTRLAGGNSALALAMTVISNLLGILIVPYSISKFIAAGVGVSIPTEQLLRSLVLTLLVPLILGKVARELFKGIAEFSDQNRKLLAVISAIFLSSAPWIQVSRSRSLLLMVKPSIFLIAVVMGVLLHFALFAFNASLIPSLSLISGGSKSPFAKKENVNALLLVASQKTLPVMVAVVEQLGGALGASALLILPCVAAHLNQIIIDSFLVSLWKQRESAFGDTKIA